MDKNTANSLTSLSWHWRPDVCARLQATLQGGAWVDDVDVVKQTPRRSVYHKTAHRSKACPGIYIKHEHPVNPRDVAKLLFRNKTRMEFDCACRLYRAGIHTAEPIGWGRRGLHSALATCEIEGGEEFLDAWNMAHQSTWRRVGFLADLACCLKQMIRKGVSHPDMHGGNILVNHGASGWDFFLLDTYKCRVGQTVSSEMLRRCLGWIVCISHELSDVELSSLLQNSLSTIPGTSWRDVWHQVLRSQHQHIRHRGHGRRKRLFNSGSVCRKTRTEDGLWLIMRHEDLHDMAAAVQAHRDNRRDGDLLKADKKRRLSRVRVGDRRFVVKEFRAPGVFDIHLWRADARCWFNTYRLGLHYIPIARALGWLRATSGKGYLIMEGAGEECLFYGLDGKSPSTRRCFMKAAGKLTAWLHLAAIHHRDLKCSNLMITDPEGRSPMPLCLIDLDAVRFPRWLTGHRQCRNLLQFLESLPRSVTNRERLTYLVAYRRANGISRVKLRSWLDQARFRAHMGR